MKTGRGDAWIFVRIVLPVIFWSVAGTLALSAALLEGLAPGVTTVQDPLDGIRAATVTLLGLWLGVVIGGFAVRGDYRATLVDDAFVWFFSCIVVAAWVWLGAWLFNRFAPVVHAPEWSAALLTTFAPLWLMTGTLVGAIYFAAFRLSDGPMIVPDSDREWIGRVSGIKFKPMLAWAIAAFSALLLSEIFRLWVGYDLTISGIVAVLAGTGAVAGGNSRRSGDMVRKGGGYILRVLPFQAVIAFVTLLFIVALFVLLAGLERRLVMQVLLHPVASWLRDAGAPLWIDAVVVSHSVLLIALAVLILVLQRMIPINRFSMNGLYRNRLARGFLGAARMKREPNPFTGFDSGDNERLFRLTAPAGARPALYPVINAALNVTASENLAWQERKAEPFVFTPLFSGSGMLSTDGTSRSPTGAYVPSCEYAGSERDIALDDAGDQDSDDPGAERRRKPRHSHVCKAHGQDGETAGVGSRDAADKVAYGVTLATAMSISGAAASPNMGYHSSAPTAFLMTLFNLRLGAWLPNPARADKLNTKMRDSSPRNSLWALIGELVGATSDKSTSVYLSDGGHFENLGIYEMLRRRCRYIVVSDAGADPKCAFTDLGNAVRKAKIDMDIDVNLGRMCISARNKDIDPQLAWAIGQVQYPEGGHGEILYLKPSFFGKALPVDVVAYAQDAGDFPHESTADQWFSESQFESYRRLGFYFADQLAPAMGEKTVADFSDAARRDYASLNPQPLPPVDVPEDDGGGNPS